MIGLILSALASFIGGIISKIFGNQRDVELGQAQQKAVDQVAAVNQAEANVKSVQDTVAAERAVDSRSASSPGSLRDPSPDSRD